MAVGIYASSMLHQTVHRHDESLDTSGAMCRVIAKGIRGPSALIEQGVFN
jgi:hypothetical protein